MINNGSLLYRFICLSSVYSQTKFLSKYIEIECAVLNKSREKVPKAEDLGRLINLS